MKRNTLSTRDYVIETIFWAIIAFVWYQNLFFTNIEGKTVGGSNVILIVIVVLAIAVNMVLTISWNRTTGSAITSVLIPYGVYAYITYAKYITKVCRIIALVTVGICVLAMIYILAVKLHAKSKRRRIVRKAKMAYSTIRFVGAAASVSLIVCLFCNVYVSELFTKVTLNP